MVTYSMFFKDFKVFIWMGPTTMVTLQKINNNQIDDLIVLSWLSWLLNSVSFNSLIVLV